MSDFEYLEILNYPISEKNKQLFLNHIESEKDRKAMEKFINQIVHITHQQFFNAIDQVIDKVITFQKDKNLKDRPIFVFTKSTEKNKSSYWIYTYIKKYFNAKNIKIILTHEIDYDSWQDNDIFLFVDDCIYSGSQMSTTITEVMDALQIDETNNTKKKINSLLVVPYISDTGESRILRVVNSYHSKKEYFNFEIIYLKKILPADNYLNSEEYKSIFEYYPNANSAKVEFKNYLIYFDHKVADGVSSFPYIFNGIVPNNRNKPILVKICANKAKINILLGQKKIYSDEYKKNPGKKDFFQKILKLSSEIDDLSDLNELLAQDFDYYPLLTNCENINKSSRTFDTICPLPPYKDEYENYLNKIKKTNPPKPATKIDPPKIDPPKPKPPKIDPPKPVSKIDPSKTNIENLQELINNHFQSLHDLIN
jgi:hypothetical protein